MLDTDLQFASATAPATVSNVAVGFDILGFSLTGMNDRVTVRRSQTLGVRLVDINGAGASLPEAPEENTATAGLVAMVADRDLSFGLEVRIEKGIPQKSGLGGSAASAVAAVVAASAVLDEPLSLPERFHYALLGEELAAGSPHGENIAAAMLGGLVLVRSMDPFDVVRIPVPHDMGAVVVHPHLEVDVQRARKLLKPEINMQDFVIQSANLAGFIGGCFTDDRDLIGRSLQDLVIEPQRSHLIPGFAEAKQAALSKGALGCSISGAGPTLFALHDFDIEGQMICDAMVEAFASADVEATGLISPINGMGGHIVERGPKVGEKTGSPHSDALIRD